jgi:hypothetical protein
MKQLHISLESSYGRQTFAIYVKCNLYDVICTSLMDHMLVKNEGGAGGV